MGIRDRKSTDTSEITIVATDVVITPDEVSPPEKTKKTPEVVKPLVKDSYRGRGGAYTVGEDGVRVPKV